MKYFYIFLPALVIITHSASAQNIFYESGPADVGTPSPLRLNAYDTGSRMPMISFHL